MQASGQKWESNEVMRAPSAYGVIPEESQQGRHALTSCDDFILQILRHLQIPLCSDS